MSDRYQLFRDSLESIEKIERRITMKKRVYMLLIILLLTLMLVVPTAAGRGIRAEGTVSGEFDFADRTATDIDGKCLIEIKPYKRHFEGTLEGTGTENLTILSQGPCEGIYPGKYDDRFWFSGTFEGKVDGREGTCRYAGRARTWAGSPPIMKIRMTFFRCKAELKGMTGVLHTTWEDPYWGWIYFH
jgi:hypothetical protein